jgi:hypothetical protein
MTSENTDLAGYYQSHRDDEDEWGEPVKAPVSQSRRLASMISARFAPDEAEAIRDAASAEGISVSQFIRLAALARAGHGQRPALWLIAGTHTGTVGLGLPRIGTRSGLDVEYGGALMPLASQSA